MLKLSCLLSTITLTVPLRWTQWPRWYSRTTTMWRRSCPGRSVRMRPPTPSTRNSGSPSTSRRTILHSRPAPKLACSKGPSTIRRLHKCLKKLKQRYITVDYLELVLSSPFSVKFLTSMEMVSCHTPTLKEPARNFKSRQTRNRSSTPLER